MKIYGFADASYKTQDNKVRSVEGRILFLTNGKEASPIMLKSMKIPNGDIDIQTRKEEAGEDCQLPAFNTSQNSLSKPYDDTNMNSFQ